MSNWHHITILPTWIWTGFLNRGQCQFRFPAWKVKSRWSKRFRLLPPEPRQLDLKRIWSGSGARSPPEREVLWENIFDQKALTGSLIAKSKILSRSSSTFMKFEISKMTNPPLPHSPTHPHRADPGCHCRCRGFENIPGWFESKELTLWTWSFLGTGPP